MELRPELAMGINRSSERFRKQRACLWQQAHTFASQCRYAIHSLCGVSANCKRRAYTSDERCDDEYPCHLAPRYRSLRISTGWPAGILHDSSPRFSHAPGLHADAGRLRNVFSRQCRCLRGRRGCQNSREKHCKRLEFPPDEPRCGPPIEARKAAPGRIKLRRLLREGDLQKSGIAHLPLLVGAKASVVLQALLAMALGLFIIGVVGFSHIDVIHNAAHDVRHSNAFPCH